MKSQHTKQLALAAIFFSAILSASCNDGDRDHNDHADSLATAGTMADTAGTRIGSAAENVGDKVDEIFNWDSDAAFVREVSIGNDYELKLIDEGLRNGQSAELKAHAKMMRSDHNKLGKEMTAYAKKKNYAVGPADEKAREDIDDLNRKHSTGVDWDKAWTDLMVKEHRRDVRKFETASSSADDPELRSMAEKALPTLRSHFDMMKDLQDKLR